MCVCVPYGGPGDDRVVLGSRGGVMRGYGRRRGVGPVPGPESPQSDRRISGRLVSLQHCLGLVHTHTQIHTCMHTHINKDMHVHIDTYTSRYTHERTHVHTHTDANIQTLIQLVCCLGISTATWPGSDHSSLGTVDTQCLAC